MRRSLLTGVAILFGLATLGACTEASGQGPGASTQVTDTPSDRAAASPAPTAPAPAPESPSASASQPQASDGRPRKAWLTIPALDLADLSVRAYEGTPDDARGTRIQDGGIAASPYGTGGLVGAGGIGNYLITGHRTSSTKPFAQLPDLRKGDEVYVDTEDLRYTYRIVETRRTSFRSAESLEEQSAAVPGDPDAQPTQAMITLSTCRTQEDHAEGNYWSDEFGNPEHRIDKIGVLVEVRPSPAGGSRA